jgi:hypothetical protein
MWQGFDKGMKFVIFAAQLIGYHETQYRQGFRRRPFRNRYSKGFGKMVTACFSSI